MFLFQLIFTYKIPLKKIEDPFLEIFFCLKFCDLLKAFKYEEILSQKVF